MMYRKFVIERIKQVERDHRTAAIALARFHGQSVADPSVLYPSGSELTDVRRCVASLESTYLARLLRFSRLISATYGSTHSAEQPIRK